MRYRFIGDPAERDAGARIEPGPWLDLPSDPERAHKIMANGHFEIEGAVVIKPKRVRKPQTETVDAELRAE